MENLNETYLNYNVQRTSKLQIESDDSIERYIVPLDAIIETKSYKDLMEKGNQNTKNLTHFHKSYQKKI